MKIKKQPIISWLLGGATSDYINKVGIAGTLNPIHLGCLKNSFDYLAHVQESKPDWGLPELVMPSFEEVMKKSAKSFNKIDHELFKDFSNKQLCGILISKQWDTIVYGFGEDELLHIWLFKTFGNESKLYLYFYVKSTEKNTRLIYSCPTLMSNEQLFYGDLNERERIYECLTNFLISYLAVKHYAPVETIVIPTGQIIKLEDAIRPYKTKEKVNNESGQEVIVMDSRWFRKIVNNNDIFVRGYFRMQRKKNEAREWYKELIFINPTVRHGYHRNAIIENEDN